MNKIFLIPLLAVVLVGCKTIPDQIPEEKRTILQKEYIVRIPPAELTTLPPRPASIDVDKADQADAAIWTTQREKYILELERLLIGIGNFFVEEQKKLDQQAFEENARLRAESAGEK